MRKSPAGSRIGLSPGKEHSHGSITTENVVQQIRKATRHRFSAEDKIRIVLEGLRGEVAISEVCRREGIAASVYYKWSKSFLEAGQNGLTRETMRDATTEEVRRLKDENSDLKKALAETHLDLMRYKKTSDCKTEVSQNECLRENATDSLAGLGATG